MTLYLTSDEQTLDHSNTRTKFKNRMLPDLFQHNSFNLKLQEIFFDSKFPTLANFEYPHIITTVFGCEHKLQDFPEKFQNNYLFKYLCNNDKSQEFSPLSMEKKTSNDSQLSEIDFEVFYEIHPRLNFAFSIAFIKDISIPSQQDIVKLLNTFMFPFHKKKPLKYLRNGYVVIRSNLNLYMSKNLLQLLGFNSFESEKLLTRFQLPLWNEYKYIKDPSTKINNPDRLSNLEEESFLYSNYQTLTTNKPKGSIQVEFSIGVHNFNFEIEYEMNLFNHEDKAIVYDEEIRSINHLLLGGYLSFIKENILNLDISSIDEDQKDLNDFIDYLLQDRRAMKGLDEWGGLFTLKRTKSNHILVEAFHTKRNEKILKLFHATINKVNGSPLLKQASFDIFLSSKLKKVSFNPTLSHLLGISESTSSFVTIEMDGKEEKLLPFPLNYYKSVRHEIIQSFSSKPSFVMQLIRIEEEIASLSKSIKTIKTERDSVFIIKKRRDTLFADERINLEMNSPNLIFVMANFVQHSLVGSNQKQVLNFFPFPKKSKEVVHHRFKRPIILKTIPGSVFHISLVDENFNEIKAAIGTPTLLALKKSFEENMFPVTLISSDTNNLKLFPDNKVNSFKNKLSFPLLMNHEHGWGVSLRSIAFPKVMNILSEYCSLTITNLANNQSRYYNSTLAISLDDSYVTSETKLIFLLNQKISNLLEHYSERPIFSLHKGLVKLETKEYECHINESLSQILGLSHSYQEKGIVYPPQSSISGVLDLNLFLMQPQEMLIISNIVEEAFYAQHRPKILKIVPISTNQSNLNAYNYIQFEEEDIVPVKLDRIDEIEILIMTRQGELINFIDLHDVKCQLEFKRMT